MRFQALAMRFVRRPDEVSGIRSDMDNVGERSVADRYTTAARSRTIARGPSRR
jgi:hypothetical protein